jgi:NADH-quinone oxidoreductase subunit G
MGCVRVTASHEGSVGLGDLMGDITIERANLQEEASA